MRHERLAIRQLAGRGRHHVPDGQVVSSGEGVVALVVSRDGHDRTRAVPGQHVVGDPDGHALVGHWVERVGADERAALLALRVHALDLCFAASRCRVRFHLRAAIGCGEGPDQRVLGCQHHERGPVDRVGSRGKDTDRLDPLRIDRECDLGALRAADPVGLHQPDRLRPVDAGEVEQLVGVPGDAEEPLLKVALDDRRSASPAAALRAQDLLARQDHLVLGAPVDGGHRPVRQPGLIELRKQPLRAAVVVWVAGDHLPGPVEHATRGPELRAHALDVLVRPGGGMYALVDRRVLGRQPEAVKPHWEHDVEALHAAHARHHVRPRHRVPVTDVQIARGIRVHRQQVVLGSLVLVAGQVQPVGFPALAPHGLEGGRVEALATRGAPAGLRGHAGCLRAVQRSMR